MWGVFCVTMLFAHSVAGTSDTKAKLDAATQKVDEILNGIYIKWQIDKFPNFLRSVAMSHASWDVLKLKFQSKILNALDGKKEKFVVSFMGSSVTAGHDTPFNITFTSLVGVVMSPPFNMLGIDFESRNSALGNNPCLPYDTCVKAFAGKDADMVHWEQSFNCFGSRTDSRVPFEHFIRESLSLPNQAVAIFTTSATPNWKKDECKDVKEFGGATAADLELVQLIESDPIKVVSEKNFYYGILNPFSAMTDLFKTYKTAGVQMWVHTFYEQYKCHGPYIPDWGCCSASWHPSILGHQLRADHYSYFWLLILRDALKDLTKSDKLQEKSKHIEKLIHVDYKYSPHKPLYESSFNDGLTCYTSFEPMYDPDLSLVKLVLQPPINSSSGSKEPFKVGIMEDFLDKGIVIKARASGYKDYKYMLYGNNESLPLSLRLDMDHTGIVHVCEPPGHWGKLPKGFNTFYRGHPVASKAYITMNVPNYDTFEFNLEGPDVKEVKWHDLNKGTQYLCAEIREKIPLGKHVLTIVPQTNMNIMFSYLIVP